MGNFKWFCSEYSVFVSLSAPLAGTHAFCFALAISVLYGVKLALGVFPLQVFISLRMVLSIFEGWGGVGVRSAVCRRFSLATPVSSLSIIPLTPCASRQKVFPA